ncbi:Elongator subunit ELP4 KNAG_0A01740 [Huiozyma naganishii CBS 8797]|uniref:Elongator complex protein 4 n=1 Tax=Huiozyma naganishii (strain ATCC MYA-139 / BCRC 22969 / CBS 8797 / KCTC 17520 / NBRC 10181 / NCYC 3082 / Yp74L-3) TaxID=1071383 RepID=J7RE80_HUIN7|nr:hypothetical protein KNAG_0A01740 [Kazachstania naganishii CBS 8797]CCK67863.1 hypothetical protein KNAG_0A01740 [Kazachstania naganishii CBS 8797]
MSFRKRGEVLNGRNGVGGVRGIPTGRGLPRRPGGIPTRTADVAAELSQLDIRGGESPLAGHVGVRPSPLSANLVTSTGCGDLDKILGHMGLPLGSSLLVEEETTTDFSSVLCKMYAAQSVVYARAAVSQGATSREEQGTHLVVLSGNADFARELPGVYQGSRRDVKKTRIAEEESKLSVQNLNDDTPQRTPTRYTDLKIAWKYKLADERGQEGGKLPEQGPGDYTAQFDITTRMIPAASVPGEITMINPVQQSVQTVLAQLEAVLQRHRGSLVRILAPQFLHPAAYPPGAFAPSYAVALVHGLQSTLRKHSGQCVLMASTPRDILSPMLACQIENLFDGVIDLDPFPQDMLQYLEKIYRAQPGKVQHGLLHVTKLPVLSAYGEMHERRSHWAFKNGKKRFEIEEWSIPVDDDAAGETPAASTSSSTASPTASTAASTTDRPAQSTKHSIEY